MVKEPIFSRIEHIFHLDDIIPKQAGYNIERVSRCSDDTFKIVLVKVTSR